MKENAKLIQKVNELGTKWTSISKFFTNKSPPSLKMQYSRLKKRKESCSDQNELTVSEGSQNNIRNILKKHLTRNDKINQKTIFESTQVFQEIIQFSIDFPTSCPFLSYILMDLFDRPNYSKQIFLEIILNEHLSIFTYFYHFLYISIFFFVF